MHERKNEVKSLSCVRPSATPWIAAYQAPPSVGFSRQEYWSGVPLPSPYLRSAYLRLLIFLPAILIPAFASSRPAFLMMFSAYKLNKQGDNMQPWRTLFPIWNQSVVPCPVLTVASWASYKFLQVGTIDMSVESWWMQVQEFIGICEKHQAQERWVYKALIQVLCLIVKRLTEPLTVEIH